MLIEETAVVAPTVYETFDESSLIENTATLPVDTKEAPQQDEVQEEEDTGTFASEITADDIHELSGEIVDEHTTNVSAPDEEPTTTVHEDKTDTPTITFAPDTEEIVVEATAPAIDTQQEVIPHQQHEPSRLTDEKPGFANIETVAATKNDTDIKKKTSRDRIKNDNIDKGQPQEPLPPLKKAVATEVFIKPHEKTTHGADTDHTVTITAEPKKTRKEKPADPDNRSPITTVSHLEKTVHAPDVLPNVTIQSSDAKEKNDQTPKIVVSEKILTLVESLMEKPHEPAEQPKQERKKTNKDSKETRGPADEKQENKTTITIIQHEGNIILGAPKVDKKIGDEKHDEAKTEKQKIVPVTNVEDLKKTFEYVEKAAEKIQQEDEPNNVTNNGNEQNITDIQIVVSEKMLNIIKDVRETLPFIPKQEEQTDTTKEPLPITFSTENDAGEQLVLDSREVKGIQKLLQENPLNTDGQDPEEESEVVIFEHTNTISKKETHSIELSSGGKELRIELEELKKIIELQKKKIEKEKKKKKKEEEELLVANTEQAPEELVQEDGQTQANTTSSTILNYQLVLMLLSLSNKPSPSDDIYHAHAFL